MDIICRWLSFPWEIATEFPHRFSLYVSFKDFIAPIACNTLREVEKTEARQQHAAGRRNKIVPPSYDKVQRRVRASSLMRKTRQFSIQRSVNQEFRRLTIVAPRGYHVRLYQPS